MSTGNYKAQVEKKCIKYKYTPYLSPYFSGQNDNIENEEIFKISRETSNI